MPAYFFIFLIIAQGIILLGHYILYLGLTLSLNIHNIQIIWCLRYVLSLLSLSFLTTTIYTRFANTFVSQKLYQISAIWMGFFVYGFLASILVLFYFFIDVTFENRLFLSTTHFSLCLFCAALSLNVYGLFNAQNIRIKKVPLSFPYLPEYWKGKNIVFLSDTHFGQVRNLGLAEKIVEKINSLKPDLVLHTGDFFDGVHIKFNETAQEFSRIKSTHGIFFVTGNHESFENPTVYTTSLVDAGVHVLNNEKISIEGLDIVGAEYLKTETRDQHVEFLKKIKINPQTTTILLKHVPQHVLETQKEGISLMLSGHTHRGQLWPFRYITKALFKGYDYGLRQLNTMKVYTTSGAGTWGPPMKVFTAAEIILFQL